MARLSLMKAYGVRNAAEYRAKHKARLPRGIAPRTTDLKPAVTEEADGGLRFKCACGNYPLVDPDSGVACCFSCGLVYDGLTIPDEGGT